MRARPQEYLHTTCAPVDPTSVEARALLDQGQAALEERARKAVRDAVAAKAAGAAEAAEAAREVALAEAARDAMAAASAAEAAARVKLDEASANKGKRGSLAPLQAAKESYVVACAALAALREDACAAKYSELRAAALAVKPVGVRPSGALAACVSAMEEFAVKRGVNAAQLEPIVKELKREISCCDDALRLLKNVTVRRGCCVLALLTRRLRRSALT